MKGKQNVFHLNSGIQYLYIFDFIIFCCSYCPVGHNLHMMPIDGSEWSLLKLIWKRRRKNFIVTQSLHIYNIYLHGQDILLLKFKKDVPSKLLMIKDR